MGFFDDVEYFFSGLTDAVGTFVEDTADIASYTVGGLTELMTDGVKEMFIDGNTNYKTSYELKEEAQNRISNARGRLQSRYDELEKRVKMFNEYAESVMLNYYPKINEEYNNEELLLKWEKLISIKDLISKQLEISRAKKEIG